MDLGKLKEDKDLAEKELVQLRTAIEEATRRAFRLEGVVGYLNGILSKENDSGLQS